MAHNIEYMFCKEYIKLLKDKIELETEFVSSHVLEHAEYANRVGVIQASKDLLSKFEELAKAYFSPHD